MTKSISIAFQLCRNYYGSYNEIPQGMSSRIALSVYYDLLKIDIFLLEAESEYFKNMIIANKAAIPVKNFAADTKHTVSKYAVATVDVFFPDVSLLLVSSLLLSISANVLATGKEILWKAQRLSILKATLVATFY
ncbi:MAG: hypothetical protein MZV70_23705 [Desulfobacterales bacterium]|nr:hypothetical protein [Desulfobacterales bacterium]